MKHFSALRRVFKRKKALAALICALALSACALAEPEPPIETEVPIVETEAPAVETALPETAAPTEIPTAAPTESPTELPTESPTEIPTAAPTESPTEAPTENPTAAPTETPFALSDSDYSGVLDARGELILTAYRGSARELVVPESIDGYDVAEIGAEMFAKNGVLESIELPKTLRRIGDRAFVDCAKLESVAVPDAIETVGDDIFENCKKLQTLQLIVERRVALVSARAYRHTREEESFAPEFPMAFTDFQIRGALSIETNCAIPRGHAMQIRGSISVSADCTLSNLGKIENGGAISLGGTLITCGGEFSGDVPDGAFLRDHKIENGVCTQCGQKVAVRFTYIGSEISKVYDGSTEIALDPADFRASDSGVQLRSVTARLDSADAGARTVHVEFALENADQAAEPLELPATVSRRALILTPASGQSKSYGAADPDYFTGSVRGLIKGDTLSGALSREPGENAGEYAITRGTLRASDNYDLTIKSGVFTIRPRLIADASVSGISNQKFTGSALTPEFTVRLGDHALKLGADYTAEYENNIQPGTATIRLTGVGNYSGTREIAFRILSTGSGQEFTGITSPDVPGLADPVTSPEGDSSSGGAIDRTNVQIDREGLGSVLFDAQGRALSVDFHIDPAEKALVLAPADGVSGATLELSRDQIRRLQQADVVQIVYTDAGATVRLPIDALLGALPNGQSASVRLREVPLPLHEETSALALTITVSEKPIQLLGATLELADSPALRIARNQTPRLFRNSDPARTGLYLR